MTFSKGISQVITNGKFNPGISCKFGVTPPGIFLACHQGRQSPSRGERSGCGKNDTPERILLECGVGGGALAALCGQKVRASLGRLL